MLCNILFKPIKNKGNSLWEQVYVVNMIVCWNQPCTQLISDNSCNLHSLRENVLNQCAMKKHFASKTCVSNFGPKCIKQCILYLSTVCVSMHFGPTGSNCDGLVSQMLCLGGKNIYYSYLRCYLNQKICFWLTVNKLWIYLSKGTELQSIAGENLCTF